MGRYTDENFRKKVRELVGADYSYIGEYKGSHDHLEFTHHICGRTYEVTPANFLKGRRCPSCYGNERHTDEYITAKVLEVTEGEYEFIEEYEGNKVPIKCRHNICGRSWKVTTDNFFNKSVRCPRCKTSKGEERISNILKEQAIYFEQQVKFEELRYINPLFIDFYLPEHKVAIEYDGRQHFEPIPAFGGEEEFREGKIRDRIKDDYFQEHPYIRLIRIPYTEYENIEEIIFRELKLGSN